MHDIKINFNKVFQTIKSLDLPVFDATDNLQKSDARSQFSDSEEIDLTTTSEYMSLDSENWLFNKIKSDYADAFAHLINRSRFNRRKRGLFNILELVRKSWLKNFCNSKTITS
ncbi:hypothetical protein GCM10011506_41340 [Marivirga lumbricoides]|uniref:Uncharacterized protein n=1 Tax=Marivirga lumbricoides TaxID=1046115 RepID=A0ABQ1N518_9BACT|nr:hypothetical protein GCM10011506_41340 [Marivirga lumbricoides]